MVMAGPMPGSTPIAVPIKTPVSAYSRYIGCIAVLKPFIRLMKLSIEDGHPFQEKTGR